MVAFTDEHELFSSEAANGFHAWRRAGSDWAPSPDDSDGGNEPLPSADADADAGRDAATAAGQSDDLVFAADTPPDEVAAAVVTHLMASTIVPTFERAAARLDAATQRVLAGFLGRAREALTAGIAAAIAALPAGTPFSATHAKTMMAELLPTLTTDWRAATGQAPA